MARPGRANPAPPVSLTAERRGWRPAPGDLRCSSPVRGEEQSLGRLRSRHRDLTARDVSGTPEAADAGERLKQCVTVCEDRGARAVAALQQAPEARR
ncbi:Chromate resistance protein ChrB [Streptomyces bungoensis]